LGARVEERIALTEGRSLLLPPAVSGPSSLGALEKRLWAIESCVLRGQRELMDLECLAWQAAVWPLAAHSGAARELLTLGWASYAEWITWDGRLREAGSYAKRAIELGRAERRRTGVQPRGMEIATHVLGVVLGRGRTGDAGTAAVEWLRAWLPEAAGSRFEVELHCDIASYVLRAGQSDAADACAQQAACLAERLGDENLIRVSRHRRADVSLESGQPQKALALLCPLDPYPFGRLMETLRWVRVLSELGERSTAADRLAEAYALIEQYGYSEYRASADALAREL
jgi:hypothetical protein